MASAIANTPRQLAAVSCFSGVGDEKEKQKAKEMETETSRLINTETNNVAETLMTRLLRGTTAKMQLVSPTNKKMMAIDHFLSRKEDSKLRESTLKIHKSFKNTQTTG